MYITHSLSYCSHCCRCAGMWALLTGNGYTKPLRQAFIHSVSSLVDCMLTIEVFSDVLLLLIMSLGFLCFVVCYFKLLSLIFIVRVRHGSLYQELLFVGFFAVQQLEPQSGPSRATAGPGKILSRGLITPPFCMSWDRDTEGVEREETWGEVFLHHPTMGSGERRKLRQRGPGQSPGRKWFLCIL